MKQILTDTKFNVYWDFVDKVVYVRDTVKVSEIDALRRLLISRGYIYKNLIIGKNYNGE